MREDIWRGRLKSAGNSSRFFAFYSHVFWPRIGSSIYQEVPLHPLEEFMTIAPEEARSEEVLKDEHQLLLRRLNLELTERIRQVYIVVNVVY